MMCTAKDSRDINWFFVLALQMQGLTVDTGGIAEGYKTPGQFVQVRIGDSKPGFFAIASPPDPNNQVRQQALRQHRIWHPRYSHDRELVMWLLGCGHALHLQCTPMQGVIELLVKAVPDTASELIAMAKEGEPVSHVELR